MSRRERRYEWRRLGGDYPNPVLELLWFVFLLAGGFGFTMLLAYSLQRMMTQ
jgi:hypothetical protein